jgi:CHAT domain-containing protein
VREALARAQEVYAALLLQARAGWPDYHALVAAGAVDTRELRQKLASDEALLEYLVGDSSSVVFVVTSDTMTAIDLHVTRHDLVTLIDFTRSALRRPVRGGNSELWRAPLQRLSRQLIEPVEASGLLSGKHALLIAPHAELHYLPFAALLGSASHEYLIERYRLTEISSATAWLQLQQRPTPGPPKLIALAPRIDALPGSRTEVAEIARLFGGDARVLLGTQASKRALRENAAKYDIIHLATYGVLNKDNPLFSFVELTPEGSDDGRLEVHEVFGLPLHARLVVLSACQTALGSGSLADVPAGEDWVGLVQAFLFAGASRVLATLWPVEDRATAQLMTQFYAALAAGEGETGALAAAQRSLLRNNATSHPFYWAGFTMTGAH